MKVGATTDSSSDPWESERRKTHIAKFGYIVCGAIVPAAPAMPASRS